MDILEKVLKNRLTGNRGSRSRVSGGPLYEESYLSTVILLATKQNNERRKCMYPMNMEVGHNDQIRV